MHSRARGRRTGGATGRGAIVGVLVAAIAGSALALGAASGGAQQASAPKQPRVIQLHYAQVNDGTFPRLRLDAFSRRTDSVTLSTRFHGKKASGKTRFNKNVTDTDIKGNAKHPFELIRKQGGRRVVKFVKKSLAQRGTSNVKVRAERGGRVDAIKLKIVLAKCGKDPPLFPVDCEVRRSGKHV